MRLFDFSRAPNPRRVRIFLAEKGIEIPKVPVNLYRMEQLSPEFLAINPGGTVPVLELDDGTRLTECLAICRYLEGIHPEPNLLGKDPLEEAVIEQWNRHMELELMWPIANVFRNTHPFWQGRIPQVPEYGEMSRNQAVKRLAWLEEELAERDYVAGDRFTVADITAMETRIAADPTIRAVASDTCPDATGRLALAGC